MFGVGQVRQALLYIMGIFLKKLKKKPIFTAPLLNENCAEAITFLIYYHNSITTNSIPVN